MRVMRANVDMVSAPRAIDGMIKDCSESAPEVGSQPSATPNSRISRMPDQNVGRLWPVSTKAASARSSTLPRQTAMATPAGMPMPSATSNAPVASATV